MTKLSIIIVNFNGRDFLGDCLAAVRRGMPDFGAEVIVVDNGSTDGSADEVARSFPDVRLIRNTENLGYSRATNQGIRMARGQYLLLLNSDTIVSVGSVEETVLWLDAHPDVGVLSPKVLNTDGSLQATAKSFPRPIHMLFGRLTILSQWFPENRFTREYLLCQSRPHSAPFEVDYVTGAFFLTRRSVVDRVGFLDEAMWIYWEDADWCYRIKEAGWKVVYFPGVEVVHDEGKSSRRGRWRLIYWFHRSVFIYYRKHHLRSNWHPVAWAAALVLGLRALALIALDSLQRGRSEERQAPRSVAP